MSEKESLYPFRVMRSRAFWSSFWMMLRVRGIHGAVRFAGQAFDQQRRAEATWRGE